MDLPTPELNGLRHTVASGSMAGAWLTSLFGDTPLEGAFDRLHAAALPDWVPSVVEGARPEGLRALVSDWGDLRLVVWRDHSAVLASPAPQGGWSVWPATFALMTDTFVGPAASRPFLERPMVFPKIRLHTHQAGVAMDVLSMPEPLDASFRGAVAPEAIDAWFQSSARERLAEIQAAPALCDPRLHPRPLPGTRFAPFSPFPGPTDAERLLADRLLDALADILGMTELRVHRREAPSPWREPRSARLVETSLSPGHKQWSSWIKALFYGPSAVVPPSATLMGMAPQGTYQEAILAEVARGREAARSAHQKLAAYDALLQAPLTPEMLANAPQPLRAWFAQHGVAVPSGPAQG